MFSTSVLFGALFVAVVAGYNGPLLCLRYCGKESFDPLCVSNGRELKMLNNMCEFINAECREPGVWKRTDQSECLSQVSKNLEVMSIVGSQGPFKKKKNPSGNRPELEAASRTDTCDMTCPEYFLPVCGSDGQVYKTFANLCFLQLANCNAEKRFSQTSAEKCNFNTRLI
ncbi:unnamed protein product [Hermetia illucens]|uniref:Kazal-like domain-containing protein n=1 Tax=Hermetia illucens TaxID=343691 RepID=A0A7R8UQL7_HERIL|nr:extracellular protease inhibitor 10-like [Hermetia illucens]CAD7084838.1 unnamed protein product [Hermetia illucens]